MTDSHPHQHENSNHSTPDHDSHDHDHDHDHGSGGHSHHTLNASVRVLGLIMLLNFIGFALEITGGFLFGSVALLADGFHMLFDLLAYGIAFGAAYLASTTAHDTKWAYGLHRLEPAAALTNGLLLLPLVAYVLHTSIQRLSNPEPVTVGWTLAIAGFGLLINLVCVWILHGGDMGLNEKGAYYHLLGDVGGSVLVVIATIATTTLGVPELDPIAAVLISIAILGSAWVVIRGGVTILLDQAPTNQRDLKQALESTEQVETVTDIHVWQVCSQLTVGTVQVTVATDSLTELLETKASVRRTLNENGVDHSTVEVHVDTGSRPPPTMQHAHR